jgi:polar amino acid transport system permease protein
MSGIAGASAERGSDGEPFVVCRNIYKSYGEREVLRGIDLSVGRGEVVVIMGPSGSGKSTLLRLVNHLERLDWGEITVGGEYVGYRKVARTLQPTRDLARARANARIGMVFQHFNLFEHLTAIENVVEAPTRVYRETPAKARELGMSLLASVGLERHADSLPHRLSGGQQQRVAIARALVKQPKVLLADEPTGNLDEGTRDEIIALLEKLWQDRQLTVVVVTHDSTVARRAQRLGVMKNGKISIRQETRKAPA